MLLSLLLSLLPAAVKLRELPLGLARSQSIPIIHVFLGAEPTKPRVHRRHERGDVIWPFAIAKGAARKLWRITASSRTILASMRILSIVGILGKMSLPEVDDQSVD
mmetsp:Transcript_18716/g.70826  ORF Transcript_18716/g.70826 Transcript_18716/m.70826 type:complete len:106 (+) Transcript_18716:2178-2495(+)